MLRAQIVLSVSLGIVALRASGLEPLAPTPEGDLVAPLRDLVEALLSGCQGL